MLVCIKANEGFVVDLTFFSRLCLAVSTVHVGNSVSRNETVFFLWLCLGFFFWNIYCRTKISIVLRCRNASRLAKKFVFFFIFFVFVFANILTCFVANIQWKPFIRDQLLAESSYKPLWRLFNALTCIDAAERISAAVSRQCCDKIRKLNLLLLCVLFLFVFCFCLKLGGDQSCQQKVAAHKLNRMINKWTANTIVNKVLFVVVVFFEFERKFQFRSRIDSLKNQTCRQTRLGRHCRCHVAVCISTQLHYFNLTICEAAKKTTTNSEILKYFVANLIEQCCCEHARVMFDGILTPQLNEKFEITFQDKQKVNRHPQKQKNIFFLKNKKTTWCRVAYRSRSSRSVLPRRKSMSYTKKRQFKKTRRTKDINIFLKYRTTSSPWSSRYGEPQ